jgi:hypothetical protein
MLQFELKCPSGGSSDLFGKACMLITRLNWLHLFTPLMKLARQYEDIKVPSKRYARLIHCTSRSRLLMHTTIYHQLPLSKAYMARAALGHSAMARYLPTYYYYSMRCLSCLPAVSWFAAHAVPG